LDIADIEYEGVVHANGSGGTWDGVASVVKQVVACTTALFVFLWTRWIWGDVQLRVRRSKAERRLVVVSFVGL
jgi:hypothetical protein